MARVAIGVALEIIPIGKPPVPLVDSQSLTVPGMDVLPYDLNRSKVKKIRIAQDESPGSDPKS